MEICFLKVLGWMMRREGDTQIETVRVVFENG